MTKVKDTAVLSLATTTLKCVANLLLANLLNLGFLDVKNCRTPFCSCITGPAQARPCRVAGPSLSERTTQKPPVVTWKLMHNASARVVGAAHDLSVLALTPFLAHTSHKVSKGTNSQCSRPSIMIDHKGTIVGSC